MGTPITIYKKFESLTVGIEPVYLMASSLVMHPTIVPPMTALFS